MTHEEWLREAREHKRGLCPLCAIPGWHLHTIKLDTMHIVNLGLGKHVNGNLMIEMCSMGMFGPTPLEDQLKRCWLAFREWCAAQGTTGSQKCFKRDHVRKSGNEHPELRTKAWNGRLVSAFLAHELSNEHAGTTDPHTAMLVSLSWALAEFYLVMELEGRFMSDAGTQGFVLAGETMLQTYYGLACEAAKSKKMMYGLKPKMHLVSHLCEQIQVDRRNPRLFHCFKDEDMIGKTVRVAAKCHRVTITARMMQRYMLRLALRWKGYGITPRSRRQKQNRRLRLPITKRL